MKNIKIDSNLVRLMDKKIAYEQEIFPLYMDEGYVYIATKEEKNKNLYSYIRLIFKKDVKFIIYDEVRIKELLKLYYGNEKLSNIFLQSEEEIKEQYEINGPNIELVEYILSQGILEGVSDIHIEPKKNDVAIRFRKDGLLYTFMNLSHSTYKGILGRIKVMANLDLTEKRMFFDGKIPYELENQDYDIRLSLAPTIHGEKLVMRILYKDRTIKTINDLNYTEENLTTLKKLLDEDNGIIIVTGPTGSGKSTTLYGALNYLNDKTINITTLEDPVEYEIDGINQISITGNDKLSFHEGLKNILRQDPDVIMIGEIRDEETAKIAVRAAVTGHKVLTTLHTNKALGAVNRLIDMGVEEYLLKDSLKGVIGQRLIRRLCDNCKKIHCTNEEEMELLKINKFINIYKEDPKGCSYCNYTGFRGRISIEEVIDLKNFKNKTFRDNTVIYKSIEEDLIYKILKGLTSINEGKRYLKNYE